jgi:hypothetical protein
MSEIIKHIKVVPGRRYTLEVKRVIGGVESASVYPKIEITVPPGVMNIQSQQPFVTSRSVTNVIPPTVVDPPPVNETIIYTTHHWGKQDNWAWVGTGSNKRKVVYGVWVKYYTNQDPSRVGVGQYVNVSETGDGAGGNPEWDGSRQVTAVGFEAGRGWFIQVYCVGSNGNNEPYNGQLAKVAATFTVDDPPYVSVPGREWTDQYRTVHLPLSTFSQLSRSETVKDIPVILYRYGDSVAVSNEPLRYMQTESLFDPKIIPTFINPNSQYPVSSQEKFLPSGKSYKFYFTIIRYTKQNGVWSGKWLSVKKPYTNLNELSISDIILSAEAVT